MSSGTDRADAAFCTDLVRARDFRTYAASLFVVPDVRRAWIAIAAFNAEVSYVRDHVSQPLPGEIRLQWWRDVLTGEGQGLSWRSRGQPCRGGIAAGHHALPICRSETFVRLIDARFDVYDDQCRTWLRWRPIAAIRRQRCTRCVRVLGTSSSDVSRVADHAGIAEIDRRHAGAAASRCAATVIFAGRSDEPSGRDR